MSQADTAPHEIRYHSRSRVLEARFADGTCFRLTAASLRARDSDAPPAAGEVGIARIAPLGNGGIVLHFDDGHESAPLTWAELYGIGMAASAAGEHASEEDPA